MIKNCIKIFTLLISVTILLSSCKNDEETANKNLNIVFIYTDDLGYGDISAYGAKNITTPAIDALAEEGITFRNAYSTSATCTPSRYSLLTGNYAWRKKGTGVANGDQALLIDTSRTTLPKILQKSGFQTAIIGKWHLGLGDSSSVNWNGKISPGPLEIGFDYSFIIPATGDRVPCVYVENHHVVNLDANDSIRVNYQKKVGNWPTGKENPELLIMKPSHGHDNTIINGISRIGFMEGGINALWNDETIALELVEKSKSFIESHSKKPFFLLLSTHDIHVPRVANRKFKNKSNMGSRGDVILQLDWTVKQITEFLREKDLIDNTIIIFSSDNGPVLDDGYEDNARELVGDHQPTGGLRGGKYSTYDGGTKIPLIIRWPKQESKGMISNALFSQVDFLSSIAQLVQFDSVPKDVYDSRPSLDILRGKDKKGRNALIQESFRGPLSIIEDNWKYIAPFDGPNLVPWGPIIETGFQETPQLYNLKDDPFEENNLIRNYPEKARNMHEKLNSIKQKKDTKLN